MCSLESDSFSSVLLLKHLFFCEDSSVMLFSPRKLMSGSYQQENCLGRVIFFERTHENTCSVLTFYNYDRGKRMLAVFALCKARENCSLVPIELGLKYLRSDTAVFAYQQPTAPYFSLPLFAKVVF